MTRSLRLGCLLNAEYPAAELIRLGRLVESLGYHQLWYTDIRLFRECFVGLAALAMSTRRIELGPGVTDPYSRHPGVIASTLGTLDELAGGRALLGLVALTRRPRLPAVRPAAATAAQVFRAPAVATLGLLAQVGVAWVIAAGRPVLAGVLLIPAVILDVLDGAVARATGTVTRWGGFYDAVADRVADGALLAGVAWSARSGQPRLLAATLTAMVLSFCVPYARAKAEAFGYQTRSGPGERAERAVILIVGLILGLVEAAMWITAGLLSGVGMGLGFHNETWLGGYGSWRRRLMRLGHIAFFGTALLCIAFALTVPLMLPLWRPRSLALAVEPSASALEALVERELRRRIVVIDPNVRTAAINDATGYRARFDRCCRAAHIVKLSASDASWLLPGIGHEEVVTHLLDLGAGVIQFNNFSLVAALATPELTTTACGSASARWPARPQLRRRRVQPRSPRTLAVRAPRRQRRPGGRGHASLPHAPPGPRPGRPRPRPCSPCYAARAAPR